MLQETVSYWLLTEVKVDNMNFSALIYPAGDAIKKGYHGHDEPMLATPDNLFSHAVDGIQNLFWFDYQCIHFEVFSSI